MTLEEVAVDVAARYGAPGLAAFGFIGYLMREMRRLRKELRQCQSKLEAERLQRISEMRESYSTSKRFAAALEVLQRMSYSGRDSE